MLIFAATWFVSLLAGLAGVIAAAFALRNHPAWNLEMGWMAVFMVVPPVFAFLAAIPLSIFLIIKINRKIDRSG
ncbi:MAG: hypothetical protein R6V02_03820 [Candidatus Aminicenantes bacterium]